MLATPASCLRRAEEIGPATTDVIGRLLGERPLDRLRTALGILKPAHKFGPRRLEAAGDHREDEVERRAQKQLQLRLRRATVDLEKTLEGFDFSFNPSINRQQIFDLATCRFVERGPKIGRA